jgi:hypothetical protein
MNGKNTCHECGGPLTKDDLYVFRRSTMDFPWCGDCVKKEDARLVDARDPNDPVGFFRELPRYLVGG